MSETAYNPFSRSIEDPYIIVEPESVIADIRAVLVGKISIAGCDYEVGLYPENTRVPDSLAIALNYRSFTDGTIIMQTEGDRDRFKDPSDISDNFLSEHGGRRLLAVGDPINGELVASSWSHALQGDETDVIYIMLLVIS